MRILLVENRGSVTAHMRPVLEEEGHIVDEAFNINDARSLCGESEYDCIICDLNMSPDGLSEDQIAETFGGMLTGWVWLKHFMLMSSDSARRIPLERVIIYSEYTRQFFEQVSSDERRGLKVLPKKGSVSRGEEIISLLREFDLRAK